MSEFNSIEQSERGERPTFLKVLCILSFISLGWGALSALGSLMAGPQSDEAMVDMQVQMSESIDELHKAGADYFIPLFEQLQGMMVDTNDHHVIATWSNILIIALGFFAVVRMRQGFRQGFFLYIAYSLAGSLIMYLYVSPDHVPLILPIMALIFSALFIFLYSRNLHWMR